MRFLIFILLISSACQGQIIKASNNYRPLAVVPSCTYVIDDYTGASVAYSLRKLSTSYSGSAIRVRRSSDNTEQDIGFTGCELDTASMKSFVGANSGYVVTWYDQSGNTRNATQSTAGNQPRIINSGTVERLNGKVAIRFIAASNTGLLATVSVSEAASSTFAAYSYTSSSDGGARIFSDRLSGLSDYQKYVYIIKNGSSNTANASYDQVNGYIAAVTTSASTLQLFNNFYTGSQTKNSVNNGTEQTFSHTLGTITVIRYCIGASAWVDDSFTDGNLDGYVLEIIHYNSDKSSDRSGINSNINTKYSIY